MHSNQDKIELQAVQDALYVVGGKWRFPIIFSLCDRAKRFNELQRDVKTITSRMLIKELRELEINGLVKRTVYDSSPVVVEYALTAHGNTLEEVLRALGLWGKLHREHVLRQEVTPDKPIRKQQLVNA